MSDSVYKVIHLIGTSTTSWEVWNERRKAYALFAWQRS